VVRLVFSSAMVHHRIFRPDPSQAIACARETAKSPVNAVNKDACGRGLLPLDRTVTIIHWGIVVCSIATTISRVSPERT
jgi:hypothetical protein